MSYLFNCPSCNGELSGAVGSIGVKGSCYHCQNIFLVPYTPEYLKGKGLSSFDCAKCGMLNGRKPDEENQSVVCYFCKQPTFIPPSLEFIQRNKLLGFNCSKCGMLNGRKPDDENQFINCKRCNEATFIPPSMEFIQNNKLIGLNCPKCEIVCGFKQNERGKTVECSSCKAVFTVPRESEFDYINENLKSELSRIRNDSAYNGLRFLIITITFMIGIGTIVLSLQFAGHRQEDRVFALLIGLGLASVSCVIFYQASNLFIDIADTLLRINAREQMRLNIEKESKKNK